MEVGASGGVHFHMIINRMWDEQTDVIAQECWEKAISKEPGAADGLVDYRSLYDSGGYQSLAEYITKKPKADTEEFKQLSMFDEDDQKTLLAVSTSRNLIRPEPKRKEYTRRTVRRMIEEGIKPKPGYYIDKNSIYYGVNPFTGWTYLKYTEVKIRSGP